MDSSQEEIYTIREWSPLNLNDKIPASFYSNVFPHAIHFTCIDAIEKFLAIGTNLGLVLWYNRHTGETQKLRVENYSSITCVKIVDTVEFMVAAGAANGDVSVFQIQKPVPEDLTLIAPCTRAKPIQRYTIRDLHGSTVSCCVWSKNGMKLYSGDQEGIVVLTEFDYLANQCKSLEILREAFEIVQLSVHQSYLLVSTLYRAVICQRNVTTGLWQITQIGKKDRKQLNNCGGIIVTKNNDKQPQIISGRPGLRFWLADTDGNVEKTLCFREAVACSPTWEIPILNPQCTPSTSKTSQLTNSFRNFYLYGGHDTLIVTHDRANLYILNLDRLRVEAMARDFRKILDFCVFNKEIFVLEGQRSVLRLAPMPEKPNKMSQIIFNPLMAPPVPMLSNAAADRFFEEPVECVPEEQSVENAEECSELPPIETLNLNIPIELAVESPLSEQNRRLQILNAISEQSFEETILHKSGRKKSKSKSSEGEQATSTAATDVSGIVEIGHEATDSEDVQQEHKIAGQKTTQPTLMDASFCKPDIKDEMLKIDHEKLSKMDPADIKLPPLGTISPEDLECAKALTNLARCPYKNQAKEPLILKYPDLSSPDVMNSYPSPYKVIYYLDNHKKWEQRAKEAASSKSAGCGDNSSGQPANEISLELGATNLVDTEIVNECVKQTENQQQPAECSQSQQQIEEQLQFVADVASSSPDSQHQRDPLRKSPPPSGSSGTFSE